MLSSRQPTRKHFAFSWADGSNWRAHTNTPHTRGIIWSCDLEQYWHDFNVFYCGASAATNQPTNQRASDRRVKDISKYRHRSAADARLRFSRLHARISRRHTNTTLPPAVGVAFHIARFFSRCCCCCAVPLFFYAPVLFACTHAASTNLYFTSLSLRRVQICACSRRSGGSARVCVRARARQSQQFIRAKQIYTYIYIYISPKRGRSATSWWTAVAWRQATDAKRLPTFYHHQFRSHVPAFRLRCRRWRI